MLLPKDRSSSLKPKRKNQPEPELWPRPLKRATRFFLKNPKGPKKEKSLKANRFSLKLKAKPKSRKRF